MTESTRLFWSRFALGLLGLVFALGVVCMMDSFFKLGREYAIHESLTQQLAARKDSLASAKLRLHEVEMSLFNMRLGVYETVDMDILQSWRDYIPQETKLLLLYDVLVLKMSPVDAAEKVFRVHLGEEELSAL